MNLEPFYPKLPNYSKPYDDFDRLAVRPTKNLGTLHATYPNSPSIITANTRRPLSLLPVLGGGDAGEIVYTCVILYTVSANGSGWGQWQRIDAARRALGYRQSAAAANPGRQAVYVIHARLYCTHTHTNAHADTRRALQVVAIDDGAAVRIGRSARERTRKVPSGVSLIHLARAARTSPYAALCRHSHTPPRATGLRPVAHAVPLVASVAAAAAGGWILSGPFRFAPTTTPGHHRRRPSVSHCRHATPYPPTTHPYPYHHPAYTAGPDDVDSSCHGNGPR